MWTCISKDILLSVIVVMLISSEDEVNYKIVVYVFCIDSAANNL
jgi:hypothetical protein